MNFEKPISTEIYPVELEFKKGIDAASEVITAKVLEGEHEGEKIEFSPIGITKKVKVKSKHALKMAKHSRKRNRNR